MKVRPAVAAGLVAVLLCADGAVGAGRPETGVAGTASRAKAARAAAARLEARGALAAGRLRSLEQKAAEQAGRIESLAAQHAAAEKQVAILTRQFAASVAPLRGLQSAPLTAMLLSPGSPADAALAASSLKAMAGATAAQLARLQESVRQADALSAALAGERARAGVLHDQALAGAGAIERTLVAARQAVDQAERDARDAAGRAATAASHQASLKDAIAALNKAPPTRRGVGPAVAAVGRPGSLPGAPVAGPLVQRYGQATDAGPASGVSYAPPPAALVSSPCRGRVDFAGPFRSYGKMVIVDCGRGYRFVLAGLDRVDAVPGTAVAAGAPIGRMPDFAPGAPGRPTLYVQLRHGADAVDPARFGRR